MAQRTRNKIAQAPRAALRLLPYSSRKPLSQDLDPRVEES
jgi:hypothetical protein